MKFDLAKDAENQRKHGVSLDRAGEIEMKAIVEDARFDYGEVRYRGFGLLDGRPHCLVFTMRDDQMRPISLRRARAKEYSSYVEESEGSDDDAA